MNYRHAFHAGNFGDVLKHVVLTGLIQALRVKSTPMAYLDTHAGGGLYDLSGEEAKRTGEYREGVARLLDIEQPSKLLLAYLDAVRGIQPPERPGLSLYPGSPRLAASLLGPGDRMLLCEPHPEVHDLLKRKLGPDRRAHIHRRDGYEALPGLLPPVERRGLVLIDPPYEEQNAEFRRIEAALTACFERWPQGVYAVWYPIKIRPQLAPFRRWLTENAPRSVLLVELAVRACDSPLRMCGAGMAIVNPPWRVDEALASTLPELRRALAQDADAHFRLDWLKRESTA
ncbi:MAG TPA: 23S rRNA (adenine(2030)-N(6))-methyltransferase RlmJ [Xanthomonadaceae bacterium]|nr:23S rRNA (adenine(2030)-N(6))-methyltransferase RlmJ [Xanthomonadaceae bacterium]